MLLLLLLLFPSPRAARCACAVSPPLPRHFVATVTLTLNSQVGRCRGRDAEAVARTAGVLPSVLRLDPEDDKGAVDEDAHSQLQVTAMKTQMFCHVAETQPTGQGNTSAAKLHQGAIREQQRVNQQPTERDPESTVEQRLK